MNKILMFGIIGVLVMFLVSGVVYYSWQCKVLTNGDIAFLNAIAPKQNEYQQKFLTKDPLTPGEIEFMQIVYEKQTETCRKILNG